MRQIMRRVAAAALAALVCAIGPLTAEGRIQTSGRTGMTAHAFTFPAIEGGTLSLADFKGKPVLVANTASQCGFTPQYEDLQALHDNYGAKGLVVIGVPSNDFGGQEPGSNSQIKAFCASSF
ncbi:MAG: glutathione peroxidase, partial [Alphaproteobacteria bacterium]